MIKTRATKMSKFLVVWRIEPSSFATRRPIESPRMRIVNRAYISSIIARHKLDDEERTRTAYNNAVLNLGQLVQGCLICGQFVCGVFVPCRHSGAIDFPQGSYQCPISYLLGSSLEP
jgi:hypothetical protein